MNACSSCGAAVGPDDGFCRSCGKRLAPAPVSQSSSDGERRRLTAMFYDLVSSTELSTRVDPEDLQDVIAEYQHFCAEIARNYGGTPANTMGDGGLIYFGYPVANEDDPVRAVSAGLAIIDELPELNRRIRGLVPTFGPELQVRIGVHTGMVVVGEIGSDLGNGRLAVGQTLNEAARIEAMAPANGVAVSATTARRVRGVVELESLGEHELKGIAEPVELFTVLRLRPGQGRFSVSTHAQSPLVGRSGLVDELAERWTAASNGTGGAIVLRGEAGLGKTRTHNALRQRLAGQRHAWFEIQGSALQSNTPFHPVIQAIYQILEIEPGPDASAILERSLHRVGIVDPETVALISAFLELSEHEPDQISGEERRRRMIAAICEWWCAIGDEMPTVMVAEDLHWFDPSTIELLTALIERVEDHSLLLVGTTRPVFEVPWSEAVVVIDLEPLSIDEVNALVTSLTEGSDVTDLQRARIVMRSDGVPLFAEELTHGLLDGTFADRDGDVPETLVELLTAKMDRLGPAKEVIQVASLLGREFSAELLAAVVGDVDDLDAIMRTLVDQRFVSRRGVGGRSVYLFRHALLQDSARQSLLRRPRQRHHRRIADVLTTQLAGTPEASPELVGHHLEMAGDALGAIEQFVIAARDSRDEAALVEAAATYRHAIEILHTMEEGALRDDREIDLRLELASAVGLSQSFAAAEVGDAYSTAVDLCERIGIVDERYAEALHGLAQHHLSGVRFDEAHVRGSRLLDHAAASGESHVELMARRALSQSHFWPGRYSELWENASRALELYDRSAPIEERYALGIESGVIAMTYGAVALWALGRPQEATVMAEQCVQHALEQDDVYQACYAQAYLSMLGIMLLDVDRCERWARDAKRIAEENAFVPLEGLARYTLGWAMAERQEEHSFEMLMSGLGILSGLGTGTGAPGCMAVVAELHVKVGEIDEALGYVAFGEAMAAESGQHFYTVELHRSAALAHLANARAASDDVERAASLQQCEERSLLAIDQAREQHSPSLELRAIEPLIEVLLERGDDDDAVELLRGAIDKFPEGSVGYALDQARLRLAGEIRQSPILSFQSADA